MVDQPLDQPTPDDTPPIAHPPTHIPVVAASTTFYGQMEPKPTNGLAIAALVTGVVAFVVGWIPFVGLIVGLTAIGLGIAGLNKSSAKGMSIAGLVTGGLAVLFNLIMIFLFLASVAFYSGLSVPSNQSQNYNSAVQQAKLSAKKDFAAGETAVFDNFEVKVNSVQRAYVPTNPADRAPSGKELVVVNLTVKNVSPSDASIAPYELKLDADGVINRANYLVVAPPFNGGSLPSGASYNGNIVYEVNQGATKLALQYQSSYYDAATAAVKSLNYSLQL
jgi:uncharacterized membrane protein